MGVPEKIGKYHVLDLIGTGGFGKVFRARDPYLHRDVAIKLCALEDPDLVERFAREAKISGSLHHPHIVIVHDFGYSNGRPYLVQELLPGRDLDTIIRGRDWLPYGFRFRALLQIAEAVGYAHAQGIVHRDIKPDNIRVLPDGAVKVMDFGIARFAHAGSRLTNAGMSLGTIGYLAPEQIRGEDVDRRADVFSFGVLSYELLSYRRPFQAESAFTVLHQILQIDPAPLREVWPGCPADIETCVMRCLARDRDDRFASFDELLPELGAAFRDAEASGVLPTSPPAGETPYETGTIRARSELDGSQTQPLTPLSGDVLETISGGRDAVGGAEGSSDRAPIGPAATEDLSAQPPEWPMGRVPSESYDTALRRLGSSRVLLAVAGVALLVSLGLALGVRLQWPGAKAEIAVAPPPPAPPSYGVVQVEARPWARVEGIRDAEGERWPLDAVSPFRLEVPSGRYSVVLSHPTYEGPWLCRLEVTAEQEGRCEVDLPTVTPQDYFRRVGWYR